MVPRFHIYVPLAVLGLLAGFVIGCSDGGSLDFSDEIPADAPHIDQHSLAFEPSNLTVDTGETVYFSNSESAVHTIDANGENISGDMRKGDVVAFTFDTPGEYTITCPYHPQMRATIVVE